jgi:hypothetical protein
VVVAAAALFVVVSFTQDQRQHHVVHIVSGIQKRRKHRLLEQLLAVVFLQLVGLDLHLLGLIALHIRYVSPLRQIIGRLPGSPMALYLGMKTRTHNKREGQKIVG